MGNTKEKTRKTYSLRVTENALQNIDDITGYIAYIKHQPLTAIRVGDKIFEIINRIEKNPLVFRECEEIPTKTKIYRKAICMSWSIIYKIKATEIVVLGIIHGRLFHQKMFTLLLKTIIYCFQPALKTNS